MELHLEPLVHIFWDCYVQLPLIHILIEIILIPNRVPLGSASEIPLSLKGHRDDNHPSLAFCCNLVLAFKRLHVVRHTLRHPLPSANHSTHRRNKLIDTFEFVYIPVYSASLKYAALHSVIKLLQGDSDAVYVNAVRYLRNIHFGQQPVAVFTSNHIVSRPFRSRVYGTYFGVCVEIQIGFVFFGFQVPLVPDFYLIQSGPDAPHLPLAYHDSIFIFVQRL